MLPYVLQLICSERLLDELGSSSLLIRVQIYQVRRNAYVNLHVEVYVCGGI
jgi:hypothetical protein